MSRDKYDLDDHIYYNLEIKNNSSESILAVFRQTFQRFVIANASEYYLAIPRFSIPRNEIPLFLFRVQEDIGNTDPNLGVYSITLRWDGVYYTEYLIFDPYVSTEPVPLPPSENGGFQDISTDYYYIYDAYYWCQLYNNAFRAAFDRLKVDFPMANVDDPPVLDFDPVTKLYTIYLDFRYTTGSISIYYNAEAYQTLGHIANPRIINETPDRYYEMRPYQNPNYYTREYRRPGTGANASTNITYVPAYFKYTQAAEQISTFSCLKKITLSTNLIPVNYESTATQLPTIDGRSTLGITNIITDYVIQNDDGVLKPLVFNNVAPYRYSDLISSSNIQAIDIYVYWTDDKDVERIVKIFPDSILSVKLAFIRKGLIS